MVGRCENNTDLSFVELDFEPAVVSAFDHLIELGHQQIGFIGFAPQLRERGQGPPSGGGLRDGEDKNTKAYRLSLHCEFSN